MPLPDLIKMCRYILFMYAWYSTGRTLTEVRDSFLLYYYIRGLVLAQIVICGAISQAFPLHIYLHTASDQRLEVGIARK